MAEDEREWFERLLELQLLANPGVWQELGKLGITEETELLLGFLYLAPDESAAQQLVGFLDDETDYEVEARLHPRGRRLAPARREARRAQAGHRQGKSRRAQWVVAGVTKPAALSLETINVWVEWMVAAGVANGPCAFDGWTAQARIDEASAAD